MEKIRESKFELLRIISMVMIIFHHFAYHSGFDFNMNTITLNELWIQFIVIGGKIGVNIFILISGYFLVSSKKVKISKVLKLWGQIAFTSISIYVIFVATGIKPFEVNNLVKSAFPITYTGWWFASTYFILYLISPFINILLNKLDKQTYKKMLILMLICWCVIPTFLGKTLESNNLIWFIVLYSIGGYIKLHGEKISSNAKKCFCMAVIVMLITYIYVIILDILATRNIWINKDILSIYGMQTIPILLISIFIFLGVRNTSMQYNKYINITSKAMFGVYLLHDNADTRILFWKSLIRRSVFSK